ncbi:MAG TPA: histidine kinase [Gaiellaceae bacterium]|nr:histidine kinase [Gaiellaceae bacterium]
MLGVAAFVLVGRGGVGAWLAAALALAVGWSFLASGLVVWAREEENPLGALMAAAGLAWLAAVAVGASDSTLAAWLDFVLVLGALALFVHVLVAFPNGRLGSRRERLVVGAAYVDLVLLAPLWAATVGDGPPEADAAGLLRAEPLASSLGGVPTAIALVVAGALAWLLWRRWWWATRHTRPALAPVLLSGGAALALLLAAAVADRSSASAGRTLGWLALLACAAVPLVILAGILRSRLARARVAELVRELETARTPGALVDALRRALGDPTLRVAYWVSDARGFVDLRGRPFELPWEGSSQVATRVERDGQCVAALVHDATLLDAPELLEAVTSAAGLALENERLHAELRARVDDLRESRARIVEAGDAERRRLERNLHDGAQQRLVAMSLNLRLVESKLGSDPEAAAPLVAQVREELTEALEELRELARGIHPAILSDRGLGPALEAVAARSAVPVQLSTPSERLPAPVEAAVYYVVSEALANVAKYAQASHVTVEVARSDGRAVVAVADDGVGGADEHGGSGLRGLADRVAALDGHLHVDSPPGGGTRIHADIPCA